jgi:hypothetical protein
MLGGDLAARGGLDQHDGFDGREGLSLLDIAKGTSGFKPEKLGPFPQCQPTLLSPTTQHGPCLDAISCVAVNGVCFRRANTFDLQDMQNALITSTRWPVFSGAFEGRYFDAEGLKAFISWLFSPPPRRSRLT